jgi:hypothetical protein
MSDGHPVNPQESLRAQRHQAEERRRLALEWEQRRQERLRPYQELRLRWERAWDAVYRWPNEQNHRGRKPDQEGFSEWAGLWAELGKALSALDQIEQERLEMAGPTAGRGPVPTGTGSRARLERFARSGVRGLDTAAHLLLLSCRGEQGCVASELEALYHDPELRHFIAPWLPYIRDRLLDPEPGEDGRTRVCQPPKGVSYEDLLRATAACNPPVSCLAPTEPAFQEQPQTSPEVIQAPDDLTNRLHAGASPPAPAGADRRQESAAAAGPSGALPDFPRKDAPAARHSIDFRSVHWFGADHTFSATQAACVQVLWEAWENGTPEVGQATILEHPEVEAESKRLVDVFKGHPAWGTMIVKGRTAGAYRLAGPPEGG